MEVHSYVKFFKGTISHILYLKLIYLYPRKNNTSGYRYIGISPSICLVSATLRNKMKRYTQL